MPRWSQYILNLGTAGPATVQGIKNLGFALTSEIPSLVAKYVRVDAAQTFTGGEQLQGRENIGLGEVDDTSDADKPISTAAQTALDLKANDADVASAFAAVGVALDLKAPLDSPALAGAPTAPTAAPGTNTTQISTTAFVLENALVETVPASYDPTLVGFGTVVIKSLFWWRLGNTMILNGTFVCAASAAVEAQVPLPSGFQVNASAVPSIRHCGTVLRGAAAGGRFNTLMNGGNAYLTVGKGDASNNPLTSALGNTIAGSGEVISIQAIIPIEVA